MLASELGERRAGAREAGPRAPHHFAVEPELVLRLISRALALASASGSWGIQWQTRVSPRLHGAWRVGGLGRGASPPCYLVHRQCNGGTDRKPSFPEWLEAPGRGFESLSHVTSAVADEGPIRGPLGFWTRSQRACGWHPAVLFISRTHGTCLSLPPPRWGAAPT